MKIAHVESVALPDRRLPELDAIKFVLLRSAVDGESELLVAADPLKVRVGDQVLVTTGPSAGAALGLPAGVVSAVDAAVVAVLPPPRPSGGG